MGKTKGLGRLLPTALQGYYKQGVVLDPKDKDSVKLAVSAWITELGELDATFRKSDIEHLKGFLSREIHEIRMPYARKSSKFCRRTIFIGTVNDEAFLADRTGNRRFLPLKVGRLGLDWSEEDINQLWAEAWSRYVAGDQWWPTAEEADLMAAHTDAFRARGWIEEKIEKSYAWEGEMPANLSRRSVSEIYEELCGHGPGRSGPPKQNDLKEVAACLKRHWSLRDDVVDEAGELYLVRGDIREKIQNRGGKNNGWLVPPHWREAAAGPLTALAAGLKTGWAASPRPSARRKRRR